MACSDEVLVAAKAIVKSKKVKEFTIKEVREYMYKEKTIYNENTIRGQIVGNCNVGYSKHKFSYFKKVKEKSGTYKLV
ncbi:hypothetical protein ACFL36_05930 [Thermodesulfobacteriota bacterium]